MLKFQKKREQTTKTKGMSSSFKISAVTKKYLILLNLVIWPVGKLQKS